MDGPTRRDIRRAEKAITALRTGNTRPFWDAITAARRENRLYELAAAAITIAAGN